MGGCQNYGPFWGTLNNRCRIISGTQKGTIILTTTHMDFSFIFAGLSGIRAYIMSPKEFRILVSWVYGQDVGL